MRKHILSPAVGFFGAPPYPGTHGKTQVLTSRACVCGKREKRQLRDAEKSGKLLERMGLFLWGPPPCLRTPSLLHFALRRDLTTPIPNPMSHQHLKCDSSRENSSSLPAQLLVWLLHHPPTKSF